MTYIIYYIVLFGLLFANGASAQTITGSIPPITPTDKQVYDNASIRIYYQYQFRKSPIAHNLQEGQTILLIGKSYCGFMDYYSWIGDSVNDAYYQQKRSPMELIGTMMTMKKQGYKYPLVKNIKTHEVTIQIRELGTYQYSQQLPKISWNVIPEDSVINGIDCCKASCSLSGRNWTAWYARDIILPWGPYIFDGLPGLIVLLKEENGNFVFSLNGIENLTCKQPVYLRKDKKIVKTTRENAMKACINEKQHPVEAVKINMPGVIIPAETEKALTSSPYNPIELE